MKNSDTILVTGAGGLVGSAVVEHLGAQGFTNVVGVGREQCNLCDFEAVAQLFEKVRPVQVFHAAARVYGIIGNMRNQGQSYLENTLINTSVIDAAKQVGVEKITVMGTNAIYPFPPILPFKESTIFDGRPHSSESAYAHAKRGMLAMLEAYEENYGLQWAYIVSCNLFGPRDKFDPVTGHIIPSLIYKFREALRTGGSAVLWGDGSAQRNFLYVKDVARIAHQIMTREDVVGTINIGNGEVWKIRDIASALLTVTGLPAARLAWDPTMPNGQEYRAADLSRLEAMGFKPQFSIAEGLQETWSWYIAQEK